VFTGYIYSVEYYPVVYTDYRRGLLYDACIEYNKWTSADVCVIYCETAGWYAEGYNGSGENVCLELESTAD